MHDYPQMITPVDHIEPVPRRVRGMLAGRAVVDTTAPSTCGSGPTIRSTTSRSPMWTLRWVDEQHAQQLKRGPAQRRGLHLGDVDRPAALRVYSASPIVQLVRTARFGGPRWTAGSRRTRRSSSVRAIRTRGSSLRSTRTVRSSSTM